MGLTRRRLLGALATTAALSGCSGDDGAGGEPTRTATATQPETETDPTVQVRSNDELGDILVGPEGMTLYMFDDDTNGAAASSCDDDCAQSWPPLTVEADPTAGGAVTADIDSFQREDGQRQVSADGWPLYYFASDGAPGDTKGQGVGDVWWVLGPDGTPHKPEEATTEADDGYSY